MGWERSLVVERRVCSAEREGQTLAPESPHCARTHQHDTSDSILRRKLGILDRANACHRGLNQSVKSVNP